MVGYNADDERTETLRHLQLRDAAIEMATQGRINEAKLTATAIGWGRCNDEILLAVAIHEARLGRMQDAFSTANQVYLDVLQVNALVGISAHQFTSHPGTAFSTLHQARCLLLKIPNRFEREETEAFIHWAGGLLQQLTQLHAAVRAYQELVATITEQAVHRSRLKNESLAPPSVDWEAVRR